MTFGKFWTSTVRNEPFSKLLYLRLGSSPRLIRIRVFPEEKVETMRRLAKTCIILVAIVIGGCADQTPASENSTTEMTVPEITTASYFEIETTLGNMIVRLYDETPGHRDNFRKLVSAGFYDGTAFHRVIADFMIQGGDPYSKDESRENDGTGGPGYTIPAEIVAGLNHKRGAMAAARQSDQVNPEKASSGSQFYIVHAEEGTPFLDGEYSVFGELVDGFDVLDAIATSSTPRTKGERVRYSSLLDNPFDRVQITVKPLPDYTPAE